MAHAIIILGDTHVGSRYGIWPPDALDDEGGRWESNKYQKYLWECWQHVWGIWLPQQVGNTTRIILHLGDAVEGVNPKAELIATEETTQVRAAQKLLEDHVKGASVLMCAGTIFHAGKSAQWDNAVGQAIRAVPADGTQRYARWDIWADVDGVLIQASHHIGGASADISEFTPLIGEYNATALAAGRLGYPMPSVMLRGHSHWFRRIDPDERVLVACSSWQALTPYGRRMRAARARPPSIGLVVAMVDDGKFEVISKLYQWPKPEVFTIGWQKRTESKMDQSQSSVTPTGKNSLISRLRSRLMGG